MKFTKLALLSAAILALTVFTPQPAQAHQDDLVSFGLGIYDVGGDDDSVDFRAEYRWGKDLLWGIKPFAGVNASGNGALYGLGGLYGDINLTKNLYLTPSFGAGLYSDGGGKDLDHVLEFRSQLELGYKFESQDRISVAYSHTSNAGLGDENPGLETLNLYYHVPVARLFGGPVRAE